MDTQPTKRGGGREIEVPDLSGRVLEGRYRLEELLGAGGVGVVFRGLHLRLDRPVAIKVLQSTYVSNATLLARFEREARAMAALSHPNIVTLTDYGVEGGMPYLVMELLEGKTLGELLDEGPLPPTRAFDIQRQVLRALAFAHLRGLAHRDLKPDNVFLQSLPDDPDHVKLLDFGLAKFVMTDDRRDGPQVTVAGVAFGTPAYMAPEQAAGGHSDVSSDVYAAGVLLFEMLTGRRPFEGAPVDLLRQHLLAPPPSLAEVAPGRKPAPELEALIGRALEKEPGRRFGDASEMLAELARLPARAIGPVAGGRAPDPTGPTVLASPAEDETLAPSAPARLAAPASRGGRLPVRLVAASSLVVLLVAVATAVAWLSGSRDEAASPAPGAPAAGAGVASAPASARPATPPAPRPPARDPWAARPVPPDLQQARQRLEAGQGLGDNAARAIQALAARDETDARPLLLLGRAYVARGWRSDGLDRYERAYRRDPSCRGDPAMLADLVGQVAHGSVGPRAAAMIEQIYGAEALPALDLALSRPGLEPAAADRLRTLRARLARR